MTATKVEAAPQQKPEDRVKDLEGFLHEIAPRVHSEIRARIDQLLAPPEEAA
jgi:hypothetical protein